MRDNPYDRVLEKTLKRVNNASDRIGKNLKGVKPFDKEEIPKRELLQSYMTLTSEDMNYLIQTHGEEAMNSFIYEMETYKGRYGYA